MATDPVNWCCRGYENIGIQGGYFVLLVMYVLFRTISGFLPFAPMMWLFHRIMRKDDAQNQTRIPPTHIAGVYLFGLAMFFALAVTFVPDITETNLDPRFNFVLFAEFSNDSSTYALNAVLFLPIGFLLPMVWKKFEKISQTVVWSFAFSLCIELSQMFNDRVTDIDDLVMNTLGAVIGYFAFVLAKRLFPNISLCAIDRTDHWKWEPYVCFGIAWIAMFFVQPFITQWLWSFFGGLGPKANFANAAHQAMQGLLG